MRQPKFLALITTLAVTFASTSFTTATFADDGHSGNLGGSWKWTDQVSAGVHDWNHIASSSDGSHLIASKNFDGDGGRLFTSSNYGVTWIDRTPADSDPSISQWISLASSSDGRRLVAVDFLGGMSKRGIYTSSDYGVTWTIRTLGLPDEYWNFCAQSSDGHNLFADTGNSSLYISRDYGVHWTNQSSVLGLGLAGDIFSSSSGSFLAISSATTGAVYTSRDYGTSWSKQNSTEGKYLQHITGSANGEYLIGAIGKSQQQGQIYTSNDYGATWTARPSAGLQTWRSVASSANGSHMFAAWSTVGDPSIQSPGYIYTSSDFGVTWTKQKSAGSRLWTSLASNKDGTRVTAGVWNGDIFTGTLAGKNSEESEARDH